MLSMIKWAGVMKFLPVAVVALAASLIMSVPVAQAAPPTLHSAGVVPLRHLSATWTLNSGESNSIEAATSPATGSDGSFFEENKVFWDSLSPTSSSHVSAEQVPPGTLYVHVSSFDVNCVPCPINEWSNILTVAVPPEPAPPPPPAPTFIDKVAPFQTIAVSSKQKVSGLSLRVLVNESGALTANGSVTVPEGASKLYRFKQVTRAITENVPVVLRPKLPKQALRAVKRALKHRKKLRANFTIATLDQSGNGSVTHRTIKLKP